MATMKLNTIAHRQRTYLVRDILFAVLVAVILAVQVSAFASSRPSFTMELTDVHVTQQSNAEGSELLRPGHSVAAWQAPCAGTAC